ncbi:MAG: hypothetical protein ACFFB0_01740 [Promethearchaeota archaeon]
MRKKGIVGVIIIFLFGLSMIISVPIIILSTGFSSYITLEHFESHEYTPINSYDIEELHLNVDVGNIEITYSYAPVDYHVKIELNIEMSGKNLIGEKYTDFLSVDWGNTSTIPTFTLKLLSDSWFDALIWINQNVSITITLNANILFDINTTINKEGNVGLYVPFGIHINNVAVDISSGNILYDFSYCTTKGNITGYVNFGDIKLKANNVRYTRNNIWDLTNNDGEIIFNIIQDRDMGANITGTGETNIGAIRVIYRDSSPDIGARFTFHNYSGGWGGVYNTWVGFPENPESFYDFPDVGYIFKSNDFPAKNHFNISLFKNKDFGEYSVNLSSIPFS